MAVYTEVSDEELAGFVAAYEIGEPTSFKGIAEGVENSNFLLHTTRGRFILTLYEKRVDPADLPFFLGLMRHLAERGVACPTPLAKRDGESLGTLAGRPAAIITFLDGVWPRRPTVEHCAALGAGLARMHAASIDFPMHRPNSLGQASWRPLFERSREHADQVAPGLADEIDRSLDAIAATWPAALPRGVIHADLFPDNAFFLGGRLSGIIDFYFACTDALAYDVAICLNAWCFEPDHAFNVTKARALISAYRQVRPLSATEAAALPVLARGAAMRFLLTRLHDWLRVPPGALVTPKDPIEYLRKLRFHETVSDIGGYGIDA
jgi:homoserine kinase type II